MTDVKTILGVPVAQVKSVSNIPITDVKTILGSNVKLIDYSGIIASLNLLTDTTDTEYDGTNPTLAGMETELNAINGEIITP